MNTIERDEIEPTEDESKIESLVQSAFIQKLKDPFIGVFMEGRPPITRVVGHATLVLSETEEGGKHIDLAASSQETLGNIQEAMDEGVPIKPWILEMSERRRLELAESEHERMGEAIERLKAKVDKELLYGESRITPAEIALIRAR